MARIGVGYSDVSNAAQVIISNGSNPTVDRVLFELGTGSKSTIAPLLKQWKQQNNSEVDASGLSDEILSAVKSIHDQLQQVADVKIQQALQQNLKALEESKQTVLESNNQKEQLLATFNQLKTDYAKLAIEDKKHCELYQAQCVTEASLESEVNALQSQLEQTNSLLQEQKNEVKQIRKSHEHYQTNVVEDRRRERDQYESSKTQFEIREQTLNSQIKTELDRNTQLTADNKQFEKRELTNQTELKELRALMHSQSLEAAQVSSELKVGLKQIEKFELGQQSLTTKLEKLDLKYNDVITAYKITQHESEQNKQQKNTITQLHSSLNKKHSLLQQEKAKLQGQLLQLTELK